MFPGSDCCSDFPLISIRDDRMIEMLLSQESGGCGGRDGGEEGLRGWRLEDRTLSRYSLFANIIWTDEK